MDACTKLRISPSRNARAIDTGRFTCALPEVSEIVTVSVIDEVWVGLASAAALMSCESPAIAEPHKSRRAMIPKRSVTIQDASRVRDPGVSITLTRPSGTQDLKVSSSFQNRK